MPLPAVRLVTAAPAAAVLAVAVRPDGDGVTVDGALPADRADLLALLGRERAKGEPGEVVAVPLVGREAPHTLLLAGVGDGSPASLRRAGAAVARRARAARSLASALAGPADDAGVRAHVEGLLLAAYRFRAGPEPALGEITVVADGDRAEAVARGIATAQAACFARDLVNTPSLQKTPAWLADRAVAAAKHTGLDARVREPAALAAEGFGGILGVGQGSSRPPRLIELAYRPAAAHRHVVLVGKGITFDSGGLSIKSNDGMATMKTDMGGGAAVIGAMSALAALGVRVRVTGLVPAAENMPSGSAIRPGDVLTHYGGRTVEVLNTDAEGRLVLADALAYADATLQPDAVVDLATLTGAMPIALGRRAAGLFATDDALADALAAAAEAAGERVWRMPLVEDYRDALDSPVADLRNIGDPGKHYGGGSITAALFLREFAGAAPWAHLDIAGPARADTDADEITKGGTGYGVRLLLHWLEALG